MRIKLAQLKLVTGDIEGNYAKIQDVLLQSMLNKDCDVIVYPETAFSGYCCGALWDRQEFILDQEKKIHKLFMIAPPELCIIIGFVSYHGQRKNGFPRLRNSVAVINNGRIRVYDKQLLANTGHHEERKYFEEGTDSKVFKVYLQGNKEYTIGTPICEDCWYMDHTRNIPQEMKDLGAQILISVNQSYFYYGKNRVRYDLYQSIAQELNIPVISVNAVGLGDIGKNILIYDGSSMCFNEGGGLRSCMRAFEEDIRVVTPLDGYHVCKYGYTNKIALDKFEEITNALVFALKEMYRLNGDRKPQVHLSGGLDSSIVVTLVTLAFGKDNVVAITNPSKYNTQKIFANVTHMVDKLGLKLYTDPIQDICDKILEVDREAFGSELSEAGKSCMQATLRTCLGLYNCHRFYSLLVSTTNHTELCLGFCAYLDVSFAGLMALIADLSKSECYQLSEYLNKEIFKDEIIPYSLYNSKCKPSAELPDSQGVDPIDYLIQSGLCCEIIRKNKSKNQLITDFVNKTLTPDYFPTLEVYDNKSIYEYCDLKTFTEEIDKSFKGLKNSVFKTAQCPPVPLISPYNRGFSKRETLIDKYNYDY